MTIVGLTGGIGSGKTTVATMFAALGVPVYIADIEAKRLMNRSKIIKRKLTALLGEQAYNGDIINKKYIAKIIFNNPEILKQVNAIIHPKVAQHFKRWLKKQTAAYIIKETAILFESGSYNLCDKIILVTAPKEERIRRVMIRDSVTRKSVLERMKNQWDDAEKIKHSDFVINAVDLLSTREKVLKIHTILSKK